MKKLIFLTLIFNFSFLVLLAEPQFGNQQDLGLLELAGLTEASGIAASQKNADVFWLHNDSGGDNKIYACNNSGEHLGDYTLSGIVARDWEDIALGPGPVSGESYVYVGDIGDNSGAYSTKYIYRFIEPVVSASQSPVSETISDITTLAIQYPEDARYDAETLMIDATSLDLYVVTKRFSFSDPGGFDIIFRIPYPYSSRETIIMEQVATIDIPATFVPTAGYFGSVAGDASYNGEEILIKTYSHVYYWYKEIGEDFWDAFNREPFICPYIQEPQGEAIGWKSDSMGYYTTSEEPLGIEAHLYFYAREDGALPIVLSSFTGVCLEGQGFLEWTTQSESNNQGWNVYRSENSDPGCSQQMNSEMIWGAGTSSQPREYSFLDPTELCPDQLYYYWLESVSYAGETQLYGPISIYMDFEDEPELPPVPEYYGLFQNWPNPFNPITTIAFRLSENTHGSLDIYNSKGQFVKSLYEGNIAADDKFLFTWDGTDRFNLKTGTGIYFYVLRTDQESIIRKMILIK